jgi:EAL domain-containing protein (putative c-di-GMP-specific phosphodiesterase class I)
MRIKQVTESFSLDRVVPFFQPIMDIENNAVWRYECLARLVTLDEQTFLPSDFLYLVESQQSVELLTETIFNRSAEYFRNINVAWNINISLQDMLSPQLGKFLRDYLSNYPNPRRVSLELIASAVFSHPKEFKALLVTCRELNIGMFIDHFGATTDNIKGVLDLPVNGIKVAGSLINKLVNNKQSRDFVDHLTEQAGQKGIVVIAEHVEQQETLDILKKMGIRYAQGFYFSHPQANA